MSNTTCLNSIAPPRASAEYSYYIPTPPIGYHI